MSLCAMMLSSTLGMSSPHTTGWSTKKIKTRTQDTGSSHHVRPAKPQLATVQAGHGAPGVIKGANSSSWSRPALSCLFPLSNKCDRQASLLNLGEQQLLRLSRCPILQTPLFSHGAQRGRTPGLRLRATKGPGCMCKWSSAWPARIAMMRPNTNGVLQWKDAANSHAEVHGAGCSCFSSSE